MQKVKDFFTGIYGKVVLVLGAVVGFLLYYLTLKNKEVNAAKARIALLDTEKQADILETEINGMKEGRKVTKKEIAEIDKVLVELHNKREFLRESAKKLNDRDIEEFWNKE